MKLTKWLVYIVIALFASAFILLIALFVIQPMEQRAKFQIEQQEEIAKEAEQTADSLAEVIPVQTQIIEAEKELSARVYKKKTEKLQNELAKAIKAHEQSNRFIDTLPADALDSMLAKRLPEDGSNW